MAVKRGPGPAAAGFKEETRKKTIEQLFHVKIVKQNFYLIGKYSA